VGGGDRRVAGGASRCWWKRSSFVSNFAGPPLPAFPLAQKIYPVNLSARPSVDSSTTHLALCRSIQMSFDRKFPASSPRRPPEDRRFRRLQAEALLVASCRAVPYKCHNLNMGILTHGGSSVITSSCRNHYCMNHGWQLKTTSFYPIKQ
jgi:hypothetical protein